eukprot:CAMPEP_0202386552 /NCGR_PEP_ID=MMETSP1127-20130417/67119_1 /ASSEMBLY_ACC=CAM_ASM_000462 /TAXON_ID=3047 /ORGANISM="Dunaliella tertiolecta, Strain CCMP1320" /LENGTH=43 /DNA_ID= /DNA_START= /DNA_END= /DNA_ORIENTATION=
MAAGAGAVVDGVDEAEGVALRAPGIAAEGEEEEEAAPGEEDKE